MSYRDPNLQKTVDVYEQAADYIAAFEQDERSMTQYIIGAISELDTPLTPASKALRSLTAYMTNQNEADFQKERDELLATTQGTIRGLAAHVRSFVNQNYFCVVGNDEKIKDAAKMFDTVADLY